MLKTTKKRKCCAGLFAAAYLQESGRAPKKETEDRRKINAENLCLYWNVPSK